MKKIASVLLLLTLSLSCILVGCTPGGNDGKTENTTESTTAATTTGTNDSTTEGTTGGTNVPPSTTAMTYAEFMAAALESEVTVDTYVQAKQSWWDNKATFYTANADGAYFIYEMACTEEEYNALVPGTRILVTGYKAEWAGEIEITDATFEVLDGTYVAQAKDLTDKLGTDDLINYQNQLAIFNGMTVVSISFKNEGGDDIYVTLNKNGTEYSFCVERYLTDPDTDVYKAVSALAPGDVINVEGFVYWYNGVNTHITAIEKITSGAKHESAMTYAEYAAAELETEVVIDAYVQAKQSWWDNKATFYLADFDGAYFIYEMPCTEEEFNALVPGTRILVTGYKTAWAGEIEIADATFEVLEGAYIAAAKDLSDKLGTDELINYQNQLAIFNGMTVVSISFKNEGGDDIYVTLNKNGTEYSFCIERYLTDPDTDVYKTVSALVAGDVINVEGFVYWYNGVNTHITAIEKTASGAKNESAMTYEEYVAAELETEVVIDAYVQAKQSWWDNKATFYLADFDGAYFVYEMPCTEEEFNALVPGTRILVTGYKAEWAGEIEIIDATFEVLDGAYIAPAKDLTDKLGTDELINYQNQLAIFNGMTVVSISFKNEGGDDIYVTLSRNGTEYSFCIERYLTDPDTDVYKAVSALVAGDIVNVEGFVYWYNGVNTHITAIEVLREVTE